MTAKDVLRLLKAHGCIVLRQKGSHIRVQCGRCHTVVTHHAGDTIPKGTLRGIEKDVEECLGLRWMRAAIEAEQKGKGKGEDQ